VAGANPYPTAAAFMPERLTMRSLQEAVQHCRGCPLYANATQAVFGAGKLSSEVMLVGETPGDQEDLAARRSSARPAGCSTARSTRRGSTAARPT
jgi:uracil-DNA glycosylase